MKIRSRPPRLFLRKRDISLKIRLRTWPWRRNVTLTRRQRKRENPRRSLLPRKDKQREERVKQLTATAVGSMVLASLSAQNLESIDTDVLRQKLVEDLEKEWQELQSKMKAQLRKIDHIERAKRLEEIPFLQTAYEERKSKDKKFWDREELVMIKEAKTERAHAIETQERLFKMRGDYNSFMKNLQGCSRRSSLRWKLRLSCSVSN